MKIEESTETIELDEAVNRIKDGKLKSNLRNLFDYEAFSNEKKFGITGKKFHISKEKGNYKMEEIK